MSIRIIEELVEAKATAKKHNVSKSAISRSSGMTRGSIIKVMSGSMDINLKSLITVIDTINKLAKEKK